MPKTYTIEDARRVIAENKENFALEGKIGRALLDKTPAATKDEKYTVTVPAGSQLSRMLALTCAIEDTLCPERVLEAWLKAKAEEPEQSGKEFILQMVHHARAYAGKLDMEEAQ